MCFLEVGVNDERSKEQESWVLTGNCCVPSVRCTPTHCPDIVGNVTRRGRSPMESFRTDSAHDRLTALRRPAPSASSTAMAVSRRALVMAAVAITALVLAMIVYFTQQPTQPLSTAEVVVTTPPVVAPDTLLDGESYVAIAADVGTFPPSLSVGDMVRVVVVPSFDSGQVTRSLDETAMIRHVSPPAEFASTFVITVRAPLSVAIAIADAQKVHLAVVREALS